MIWIPLNCGYDWNCDSSLNHIIGNEHFIHYQSVLGYVQQRHHKHKSQQRHTQIEMSTEFDVTFFILNDGILIFSEHTLPNDFMHCITSDF